MEKIVEIARFQFPADAQTLVAYLKSEGIECYLRNEVTATLLSYLDVGGARVEVLERDVPRALELMEEGGYLIPEEDEMPGTVTESTGFLNTIPFLRKYSFGMQIFILIIVLLLFLGIFLGLGMYFREANKHLLNI